MAAPMGRSCDVLFFISGIALVTLRAETGWSEDVIWGFISLCNIPEREREPVLSVHQGKGFIDKEILPFAVGFVSGVVNTPDSFP